MSFMTMSTVTVPPPKDYDPQAGDVWVVALLMPAGVRAVSPAGWTELGTAKGLADMTEPQVAGDVTFWSRLLAVGEGFAPVVWHLDRPVQVRFVLRVYRDGSDAPVCGSALMKGLPRVEPFST